MREIDVFLDTNVLVYFLSNDLEKARASERLLADGGAVSVQVLNEYVSVARRKLGTPWESLAENVAAFKETLTILPLTIETHERGLALARRHNLAIYDAMIAAAAQLAGCRTPYSEDLHDGHGLDGLRIVNPFR